MDCAPEVALVVALPETVVTVAAVVVVGAGAAAGAVIVEKVARLLAVVVAAFAVVLPGVDASTLVVGAVWPGSADGGESE